MSVKRADLGKGDLISSPTLEDTPAFPANMGPAGLEPATLGL